MAQDKETGNTPKAKDAEPESLEEARRRLRDERDEAAVKKNGGNAIDDQIPIDEEDDGQLFVWEQGTKVTLGTLISRGTTVEHAFVFGGKRLKGRGGLVSFSDDVLVICRGIVGKTSLVPTRDEQERVTKVVIETHIAAKVVLPADSDEGISMLSGVLDKRGIKAA